MLNEEKILVVDDEEVIRSLLTRTLRYLGYTDIHEAADSEDAFSLAVKDKEFALVITDIHMPGQNGLWLLKKLRENCPDTRVVMITASDDLSDAISSLNQGADSYLVKPLNIREVNHAVKSSMERRLLVLENREYQKNLEVKVQLRTEELRKSLQQLDRANRRIKTAYIETIYRLTVTAENRDEETGSHIKRISYYSGLLARELGFSGEEAEILFRAAPMHDLGKVGIPDNILRKQGSLSTDEFAIMKSHTVIGARMLNGSSSEYLQTAEKITLAHHENWDGTGYPYGLKEKDIPLEGAIVHLADVYDALRSRRPYKEGMDHKTAMKIINEGDERTKPSHFSPDILRVLNRKGEEFDRIFKKNF